MSSGFSLNQEGLLSVESQNMFSILRKWLYTEQDVVFRELVANALDAISKREALSQSFEPAIHVNLDVKNKQLVISDNGIGMTSDEVQNYINNIAFSGAKEFINISEKAEDQIIGHFGVGFYSSFMYANHVAIETLSCQDNAEPVRWDCTDDMKFQMKTGGRETIGTSIIMYLEDSAYFLKKPELVFDALKKYFPFVKTPIYLSSSGVEETEKFINYKDELINEPKPIWKTPRELVDKGKMNAFYKNYFQDDKDAMFWINFESLDLGVRGILYFRNTKHGTEELDGKIRIYNRGVYIGENISEMIPKYINLQNGIIECDNLDLAVSRSSVREDSKDNNMLALIFECLTQEVSIAFNDLFTNHRDEYESYWPEIHAFIKYGILQDRTFSSVMGRKIVFEDINGKFHTMAEYLEDNTTVYYASDRLDQAHYIEIFKKLGLNALLFDHVIDQPLLYRYEVLFPKVKFTRMDSDFATIFDQYVIEENAMTQVITDKFRQVLGEQLEHVILKFVELDFDDVSIILVNDEQTRRMTDMMEMYGIIDDADLELNADKLNRTLVINLNHPIIKQVQNFEDQSPILELVLHQLYDLALMSQQALNPTRIEQFIQRSEKILLRSLGD